MSYFENLPIISYQGHQVRNLLARSRISDGTKNKTGLFYPYTMTEEDRIDILSDKYYDNPQYHWLILLANDVVDPYYDLYVNDENFVAFIAKKYGSIEKAQSKIKNYISNWYGDESKLTTDQYDALQDNLKKFYNPVLDSNLFVAHYERKKKDLSVSTNKVVSLGVTNGSGFKLDEKIKFGSNSGFVTYLDATTITIHHVTGSFANGNVIVGEDSGASATVSSVWTLIENIPSNEIPYWTSVSYYDYEIEKNYRNKEIKLIDNRYKQTILGELKRTMS